MPYVKNPFNGKMMYRSPDKYAKRNNIIFCAILFFIVMLDGYASKTVGLATIHLETMETFLSPVSWYFRLFGIQIAGGFVDGPQLPTYYRVLMLNSALLTILWGGFLVIIGCKRAKIFKYPAYAARVSQRNALRHPSLEIFRHESFFWLFLRVMQVAIIYADIMILFYVYPGRVTFHTSGLIMPTFISLIPAAFLCLLPSAILGLISCIFSDIDLLQKRFSKYKTVSN